MQLPIGKVSNEVLSRYVFCQQLADPSVLLGPRVGEDAALVKIGDYVVALKSDPITGAVENVGWLAVHVNANDIATRGAAPKWFLSTILLPEGSDEELFDKIVSQIRSALSELNATLVGGHSEVVAGLSRPMVIGAMAGLIEGGRTLTSGGARPGDLIVLTKTVGIEGTAILATDYEEKLVDKVGWEIVSRAKSFIRNISVVKECLAASKLQHVTAIHDLTEGGLTAALNELSEASKVGFEVELDKVPIAEETVRICESLEVSPFQLISSGSVLITVREEGAYALLNALRRAGVRATVIGKVIDRHLGRKLLSKGELLEAPSLTGEELWKVFKEYFR